MATDQLSQQLEKLSVGTLSFPAGTNPKGNPIDVYRAHITKLVNEVSGVDPSIIYPAIQWTSQLENGDLQLPIPALRVKGKKPAELSEEWLAKVRLYPLPLAHAPQALLTLLAAHSSPSPPSSRSPRPSTTAPFSSSTSSLRLSPSSCCPTSSRTPKTLARTPPTA